MMAPRWSAAVCCWLPLVFPRSLYKQSGEHFDFCFQVAALTIPNWSPIGSIWAPKWMSRGLPIASGPVFQRMPRINRIFVPFGSLKIRFKDPSWHPFGSHDGFQNASFRARFLNVISDTFLIRFWLHFCLVWASFLYHFRLVWRVRRHAQKLHPYGTKTSFLLFQPVSNSLQNAHYVEDRLGAPAGFKKCRFELHFGTQMALKMDS